VFSFNYQLFNNVIVNIANTTPSIYRMTYLDAKKYWELQLGVFEKWDIITVAIIIGLNLNIMIGILVVLE